MKSIYAMLIALLLGGGVSAQVTRVSLQASGLTCSMCSKAVKNALEKVSFVDKVQVDIKNQQYNLTFKEGSTPDFDALAGAVEGAGFSVAALKVTADLPAAATLAKDEHLQIGGQTFHFLNAANQSVSGSVTFSLVDKNFVAAKEYKKWSALSKMACVKTGRMASCCTKGGAEARIFHAII
ncbi:copper chaperone [Flaviaesturariibacter flavus]|uniref:Copper chaperone n=1 Tax=Flaviaesturariibacter flavus TaxID=2502780 RepID=A0A4R1BJY9_9BACT|nr:heavy-metal-associated domain-containing protein [Flaviaesturariibacter flavus]TCJ17577.1 copper chaperone [Flaviaesturariibacter flavus]